MAVAEGEGLVVFGIELGVPKATGGDVAGVVDVGVPGVVPGVVGTARGFPSPPHAVRTIAKASTAAAWSSEPLRRRASEGGEVFMVEALKGAESYTPFEGGRGSPACMQPVA